jgi:hypothetical protein
MGQLVLIGNTGGGQRVALPGHHRRGREGARTLTRINTEGVAMLTNHSRDRAPPEAANKWAASRPERHKVLVSFSPGTVHAAARYRTAV